jgi:hypothetical protein
MIVLPIAKRRQLAIKKQRQELFDRMSALAREADRARLNLISNSDEEIFFENPLMLRQKVIEARRMNQVQSRLDDRKESRDLQAQMTAELQAQLLDLDMDIMALGDAAPVESSPLMEDNHRSYRHSSFVHQSEYDDEGFEAIAEAVGAMDNDDKAMNGLTTNQGLPPRTSVTNNPAFDPYLSEPVPSASAPVLAGMQTNPLAGNDGAPTSAAPGLPPAPVGLSASQNTLRYYKRSAVTLDRPEGQTFFEHIETGSSCWVLPEGGEVILDERRGPSIGNDFDEFASLVADMDGAEDNPALRPRRASVLRR